mgnify:CR=1 FL=1
MVNAQRQRFEEGNERVNKLLIVKVEFEADEFVKERMRKNVVYAKKSIRGALH